MANNHGPGSVKGLIFKHAKIWIINEFGKQGFNKFVKSLSDDEQTFWNAHQIKPTQWYPAQWYRAIHDHSLQHWEKDLPQAFEKAAAYVAFQDLSTIMKTLIKLGTPYLIASRLPIIWRHYFDTGLVAIENRKHHFLTLTLSGTQVYGLAGCDGTIGWTRMALEYAGAKHLKIEHNDCHFRDAHKCVFNYFWDE